MMRFAWTWPFASDRQRRLGVCIPGGTFRATIGGIVRGDRQEMFYIPPRNGRYTLILGGDTILDVGESTAEWLVRLFPVCV